jgi:outer membrane protein
MNRSIALALSLFSGMALSAAAQTTPAAGTTAPPAKIAVIAFQAAVGQTNEGKRNFADLEKKFAPKEQELKGLNDEIETLTKQLQTQGNALSETERASRAKAIDEKKKKLERSVEDSRSDFQQQMQEVYNGLASKVYDVMSTYAQQQGYTLVLDMGQQQTPVLYTTDASNITKAVIEAYNVKSGIPAPPAQPAAAAKPAGAQ